MHGVLSRVIRRRNWLLTDGHVYIGRCQVSAVLSDVAAFYRSEYIAGAVVYNMVSWCSGKGGGGGGRRTASQNPQPDFSFSTNIPPNHPYALLNLLPYRRAAVNDSFPAGCGSWNWIPLSTSNRVGLNCHTDPYSFSAAKPVDVIACKKSVQGTVPGVEVTSGLKKRVRKTFSARASTGKVGCGSCPFSSRAAAAAAVSAVPWRGVPRVFTLTFGAAGGGAAGSSLKKSSEKGLTRTS